MKIKTNTPPGWLERQAQKLIEEQGYFLLAYDVVKSSEFIKRNSGRKFFLILQKFNKNLNHIHKKYLIGKGMGARYVRNKMAPRILFGFDIIIGDAGGAFLNNIEPIRNITTYAKEHLPFELRWITARDEWDRKLKMFI